MINGTERSLSICKADRMIQKGRVCLTMQEQKCVLYAISKIKPTDQVFEEYTFTIKDYCATCGIKGNIYKELKNTLSGLRRKTWWIETDSGEESEVSWFEVLRMSKNNGTVTIGFHRDMMPYLLNLTARKDIYSTIYSLRYILPMVSQYSPRLYEILKSYQKNNIKWFFEITELKARLNCTMYNDYCDFRRRVLEPSVNEINLYTDISVTFQAEREGKKVTKIIFLMKKKNKKELFEAEELGTIKMDGLDYIEKQIELVRKRIK